MSGQKIGFNPSLNLAYSNGQTKIKNSRVEVNLSSMKYTTSKPDIQKQELMNCSGLHLAYSRNQQFKINSSYGVAGTIKMKLAPKNDAIKIFLTELGFKEPKLTEVAKEIYTYIQDLNSAKNMDALYIETAKENSCGKALLKKIIRRHALDRGSVREIHINFYPCKNINSIRIELSDAFDGWGFMGGAFGDYIDLDDVINATKQAIHEALGKFVGDQIHKLKGELPKDNGHIEILRPNIYKPNLKPNLKPNPLLHLCK